MQKRFQIGAQPHGSATGRSSAKQCKDVMSKCRYSLQKDELQQIPKTLSYLPHSRGHKKGTYIPENKFDMLAVRQLTRALRGSSNGVEWTAGLMLIGEVA